jgi:undecaprenyl-diphosphatase
MSNLAPLNLDQNIVAAINGQHFFLLDYLFLAISYLGEYGIIWIILAAIVFYFDKKNGRRNALLILLAVIIEVAVNDGIIKHIFYRPRPYLLMENIHQLGPMWKSSSFVSGHTASSIAAGLILIWKYKKWLWPIIIFTLLMAYSRLYLGMHYPTDILGGIIVGSLSATAAVAILRKKKTT